MRTQFEAIGTRWDIQVHDVIGQSAWGQLVSSIHDRIETFDTAYSRFRTDSLVAKLASKPGTTELPSDGYAMLAFYEQLYHASDGKITPLIGQTIADAGYDATYSFTSHSLHQPPAWDEAISYDQRHITLHKPALLDFGAAGKGYLVDIVSDIIGSTGIQSYLINAGGDILHRSAQNHTIEIGLENPFDTTEAIGTAILGNQSLCASAGSKRKWKGFHHIINPTTLSSPENIVATWTIADETMIADGLATALFFTDAKSLQKQFTFSYAILHADMSMECSQNFPAKLFNMEQA